jgi:hypothetical protein
MGGVITEEQAISRAQYLDLVYSQTGTLYDLLPKLPRPGTSNTSTPPATSHAADGVIGTTQATHILFQVKPLNLLLLMFKMLRLLPLPPEKLLRSMLSNLPQTVKKNLKRGEARIRREKIIIKQRKLKPLLLKIEISANHDTLSLSVVTITTQRILHDVPRSLSSFKEPQNHLHRQSYPNPSRLKNRLS